MKKLSASVMLAAMLAVGGFAAPATAAPKSADNGKSSERAAKSNPHTDAKDSVAIGYWPSSDDNSDIAIGYWPNSDDGSNIAIGYWPNSGDSSIMIGYWPN